MSLTLEAIQTLAPDQSSYDSAKKLLKPAKWSAQGGADNLNLIWANCQGSGSNPYYTVVDVNDHGYKCTCPSRKFPCKHALALMLMYVNDASQFTQTTPPTWVSDWLGRRRKTSKTATTQAEATSSNSNSKAKVTDSPIIDSEPTLSAEELAKKQATQVKRAEKLKADTDSAIQAGLTEFEQWLQDQCRMGFGALIDNASSKCRQISARLNDAKATGFASRIDEIPATLANCPKAEQVHYLVQAFGRLVLLSQAWQTNPNDPDARRAMTSGESKDKVLENPNALKLQGIWQNIGEISEVRKDGLISYATWLVRLADPNNLEPNIPQFALLLDYQHPSAGKRQTGLGFGNYMVGELCFYPSRIPLRGFFLQQETISTLVDEAFNTTTDNQATPNNTSNAVALSAIEPLIYPSSALSFNQSPTQALATQPLITQYQAWLGKMPWLEVMPYALPKGRVVKVAKGEYWWLTVESEMDEQKHWLRLSNDNIADLVLGSELATGFVLWDGLKGQLLSVVSEQWGLLSCQN
ncbi:MULTISPECIES: SWIM zinc finger family protein [unclassified Moraxella]|uniref:SWIM zinc finger family protein n=1 Tax=unclassified Moraxella TaxID=2685852 RepID=UPI003AF6A7CA